VTHDPSIAAQAQRRVEIRDGLVATTVEGAA
jgi:ABC-type lipoprotein export system ATPase subunit